ncbi:hypothetical protein K8I31_19430, partial [bacterium]|nr:hypothetical protein [bacterium]
MNEDAASRKYHFPPWRASHCVWLMLCLLAAAIFIGRTLNFEFQESDYYSLVVHNLSESIYPWQFFIKQPLICGPSFGDREPLAVYHLISWVNWRLFGLNPFFHQLALGAWWAAALCLLYFWNRSDGRALAGVIAAFVLLSMNASWGALLSKNELIVLCPLVFQLAALYMLRLSVEKSCVYAGLLFLLALAAAAYANWQILFTFPFVALTYVLSAHHGSRTAKVLLMVFMAIIVAVLLATSSVFTYLPNYFDKIPSQGELLNELAYPAQAIFSQRAIVGLTLLAVTIALARSGLTGYIAIALSAPAIAGIYFACRYYNIPVWASYALGMAFYVNLLWISPMRRKFAAPLAWFLLSFVRWYIFEGGDAWSADMYHRALHNAFYLECGVALAWLLGVTLSNITAPGFSCFTNIRPRFRYACRMLAALLVLIALPLAVGEAFKDFDQIAAKREAEYDTPYKLAMQKLAADVQASKEKRLVSFNEKAIQLFPRQVQRVEYSDAIKNLDKKITFEAYTGNTYFYTPRKYIVNSGIYVEDATPAAGTERDPFFMPRKWRGVELSADEQNGPLATLTAQDAPVTESLKTQASSVDAMGHTDFVITGWAACSQWRNVESLALTVRLYDREFLWNKIEFQDSIPGLSYKRFVIDAFDAAILRTPERMAETIELEWTLAPVSQNGGPVIVTIDSATLYI